MIYVKVKNCWTRCYWMSMLEFKMHKNRIKLQNWLILIVLSCYNKWEPTLADPWGVGTNTCSFNTILFLSCYEILLKLLNKELFILLNHAKPYLYVSWAHIIFVFWRDQWVHVIGQQQDENNFFQGASVAGVKQKARIPHQWTRGFWESVTILLSYSILYIRNVHYTCYTYTCYGPENTFKVWSQPNCAVLHCSTWGAWRCLNLGECKFVKRR